MEHSKLPWMESSSCLVAGSDGMIIANLIPLEPNGIISPCFEESQANAAFIVKACNKYGTLTAKAELFDDFVKYCNEITDESNEKCSLDMCCKINELIDKAKEM